MRKEDLDPIEERYSKLPKNRKTNLDYGVLGLSFDHATALRDEIYRDLTSETGGVSWWKGHQIPPEQIPLVSDYLYLCSETMIANLIEARISLFEAKAILEKIAKKELATIQIVRGRPTIVQKTKELAQDHFDDRLLDIHLSSIFRAIGSSLDCLTAVVAGVVGVPKRLLWLKYGDIFGKYLEKNAKKELIPEQLLTLNRIAVLPEKVGPKDWLAWALGYRNMLVHRGKLPKLNHLEYVTIGKGRKALVGLDKNPLGLTREFVLLHRWPDISAVELFLQGEKHVFLQEECLDTLHGIFASTSAYVEDASKELLAFWKTRRKSPNKIQQPVGQWEERPLKSRLGFKGYAPQESFSVDEMMVDPRMADRLKNAKVMDGDRQYWKR